MSKYTDGQVRDILQYEVNERVDIATGDAEGDDTIEFVLEYSLTHPSNVGVLDLLYELREWRHEVTVEDLVGEGGNE